MNTKRTKRANHISNANQNTQTLETQRFQRRARRIYAMLSGVALTAVFMAVPAMAAETGGDALAAVNNLSTFIFALIRAVGIILLGYGILQVGLSFQSHDPSQRSNGIPAS